MIIRKSAGEIEQMELAGRVVVETLDLIGERIRPGVTTEELDVVFVLQLSREPCIERLTKRALLEGRVDDTPEAIAKRLEIYRRETEPLIEWYRIRSNVVTIHADRSVNEVFAEIQQALEQAAVA